MDRREFIAAAGNAAALASTPQAFAQGMMASESEEMHAPKYKALEKTSIECVATGNDCLRHCLGMYKMKDTSMAECADSVFQLIAGCDALAALAAVNSEHTGHLAKVVEMLYNDCKKECDKFPKIAVCKTCGDACKACAAECAKVAA